MPQYLYRCPQDGAQDVVIASMRDALGVVFCDCGAEMRRDYKAEKAGVSGLAEWRKQESTNPRDFLPTRRDFEKQAAAKGHPRPDKAAGAAIKEWKATHEPAPGAKKPVDIEKL